MAILKVGMSVMLTIKDITGKEGIFIPIPQEGEDLTFGQKSVGYRFNPSGNTDVDAAKLLCAALIDLNEHEHAKRLSKLKTETARLSWTVNVFRTNVFNKLIDAQMAIVKFLTWND